MPEFIKPFYSKEEYYRMEENSEDKHEYFQGEIFQRAVRSERHNLIASNALIEIGSQLRGKPCRVYNSAMRIRVQAVRLESYPDASVVGGEPLLVEGRNDVLTNPSLIVEVASPSTEKYDRNQKFEFYHSIPTFEHYLMIDQGRVYVEYHRKTGPNRWEMETFEDITQTFQIEGLGLEIALANLYEKVVSRVSAA